MLEGDIVVKLEIINRVPELENQYSKLERDLFAEIISTKKILFHFEGMDVCVGNHEIIFINANICKIGDKYIDLIKNKYLQSIPQIY